MSNDYPASSQLVSCRIGSQPSRGTDHVERSESVSGLHAQLLFDGSRYYLQDLGSLNGTIVAAQAITSIRIAPTTRFQLGSVELEFSAEWASSLFRAWHEKYIGNEPDGFVLHAVLAADGVLHPVTDPAVQDLTPSAGAHADSRKKPDLAPSNAEIRIRISPGGEWVMFDWDSQEALLSVGSGRASAKNIWLLGDDVLNGATVSHRVRRAVEGILPCITIQKTDRLILVGRGPKATLRLDHESISTEHCVIRRIGAGRLEVRDGSFEAVGVQPSTNGTWVNGARVGGGNATLDLGHGDFLGLGTLLVRVELAGVETSTLPPVQLSAYGVTVSSDGPAASRRVFLKPTYLSVRSGEFVGILGPSGSGKTTLLTAMIGSNRPTGGQVWLNGRNLYTRLDQLRGTIGYVPQDDIVHAELTVFEALYFNARLRLSPRFSHSDIEERVYYVLRRLGLSEHAQKQIGDVTRRSLSGGQRKRVNVGLELIVDPPVIALDEATSGLSSDDSASLLLFLRELADDGRIVLLTLHTPDLDGYKTLDHVIYMVDGELTYFGPAYPNSMLFYYPQAQSPEARQRVLTAPSSPLRAIGRAINNRTERERRDAVKSLQVRYQSTHEYHELVVGRAEEASEMPPLKPPPARPGAITQLYWLVVRTLRVKSRDMIYLLLAAIQPVAIALVIALYGGQTELDTRMTQTASALFLVVIASFWLGSSNAIREFVGELPIFRRERNAGVCVGAYVASKLVVLYCLTALQLVVMGSFLHWVLELKGPFLSFWGAMLGCGFAGVGAALVVSAWTRTSEAANAWLPLLLIPQVVLGGVVLPLDHSEATRIAGNLLPARWALEVAMEAELSDLNEEREVIRLCSSEEIRCIGFSGADSTADPVAVAVPRHCVDETAEGAMVATRDGCCDFQIPGLGGQAVCLRPRVSDATGSTCAGLCTALTRNNAITPFDRVFGTHRSGWFEQNRESVIGPDSTLQAPATESQRTGSAHAALVLWLIFVLGPAIAAYGVRRAR